MSVNANKLSNGMAISKEDLSNVLSEVLTEGVENHNTSVKNDRKDDKLRWELLPLEDIEDIVKVYTEGAKKYGANNWQNLEDGYNRYKAAAFRHILEYERGNEFDEETGCRHLAQAVWNLLACLHISKQ